MDLISTMIRTDISFLDEAIQQRQELDVEQTVDQDNDTDPVEPCIFHGSIREDITFVDLESAHHEDAAFSGFRIKLAAFLNTQPRDPNNASQHSRITLRGSDKVRNSVFYIIFA